MAKQENYKARRQSMLNDAAAVDNTFDKVPDPVPASMTRGFHIFNGYNDQGEVYRYLINKQGEILTFQKRVFSSGVGIDRYILSHEYPDICFFSAPRIEPEIEYTSSGNIMHGAKSELEYMEFSFTKIIHINADPDDTAKGDSFTIFNIVEDYTMFFNIMKFMGQRYKQNSILMIPRKGTISPFIYYFKNGSTKKVKSDRPQNLNRMISDYFSGLDSKKYINRFAWSSVQFDLANIIPDKSNGMAIIVPANMRQTAQGYKFSPDNAVK